MTSRRKCCCCSSVLSCFSCFSVTPTSPLPNTSSPIVEIGNDPQSRLSSPRHDEGSSSSGIPAAVKHDEASSGGASSHSKVPSAPPFEAAKDDIVPKVVPEDATLRLGHDSKVVSVASSSSEPHASIIDQVREGGSSSQPDASANDKVREGGSCSRNDDATLQTVPDLGSQIEIDVGAVDGEKVDLDGLIKHISQLMKIIEEEKSPLQLQGPAQEYFPTTSKVFSKLKEFLYDAKNVIPGEAIKKTVDVFLQGTGAAELVTIGFGVIANILERFEDVGNNKNECMSLLKEMLFLAKLVKQFQERPNLKEIEGIADVIKEATELIVEGSIMCCTQMESSKFSKFWAATVNKEELSKFREKLSRMYTHMNAEMGISIYDVHALKKPRLSRGYPDHAVGIKEGVKEVLELLEWGSGKNAVAVMIHGFGGIGKTTLGDAVFSSAKFEGCKYSEVQLFQNIESKPDIIELQKCILKDLMGPQEIIPDIRKYEDGQRELGYMLENVPIFIYIDNVLGQNEFRQLLPRDLSKAKKLRLLLTARDINVCRACPIKTLIHSMKFFSEKDAMSFFEREVLIDIKGNLNSNQIHNIIEICGGVPLMLTLVAGVLRSEEDKEKAYNMVMHNKQSVKDKAFEMFSITEDCFFAFDSLPEKCKDPFLDVCAFFKGWEWDTVADIVGEFELDILEKRALVTKGIDMAALVHDVILTIGHHKAEGTRFKSTKTSQLEEFLNEEKDNQSIKGIWLNENEDPSTTSSSKLDSMCKSLRVLSLGSLAKVEGQCNKIFENLVFFQGGINHLPFDMSRIKKLKYLAYEPEDLTLPKMPSSLRHVEFDGRLHSPAFQIASTCLQQLGNLRILRLIEFKELKKLPEEIGDQVKALQELSLSNCKSVEELPRSISRLQFLRALRMDYCSSLGQLQDDFGLLKSLQELNLQGCLSLRQLGEGFGSLNSLQELNLQGCTSLKALPNNFEKLSSLRSLNLSSCENLEAPPHGLGNLSSLVEIYFPNCYKLRSIPDSIGQLKLTVRDMDMSHCSSLTELPDGFCNLSFITDLRLSQCKSLHRLPNRFGELASLRNLWLRYCSSLQKLPEGFGQLKYLERLVLSACESLEELCNDFHCLASLQYLALRGCKSLKKLPEDFHCLIRLQQLFLNGCDMLEGKSMDDVIKIKTLKFVTISRSRMLEGRWAEIQRESDQSWPFQVFTEQGIFTEEKEKIQKNMLSQLEFLLSEGREKPFHLSGIPLLIVFDNLVDYNINFPWPLIQETIDDIQIDFEMVYLGVHFDKLPPKAKNIIVGHVKPYNNPEYVNFQLNMLVTLAGEFNNNLAGGLAIVLMQLEDGEGGKCRPWKHLNKDEMEEFVVCKCRKYLQLKQLLQTSQESTIELLRELFSTGEGETCTFQKASSGNSKPLTCTAEDLKGKTILLEIRPLDVCYDIRLVSLTKLYNTEKEKFNLEIISIPLMHRSSSRRLDVFEQFSRDIPWLIFQNPWALPTAVKYFLLKLCAQQEDYHWDPSSVMIIESNGRIITDSKPVMALLNRWGPKAYPFTVQKFNELKREEWNQMHTMSTLEFLFNHLESVSNQVKEMTLHRKVVCLYGGNGNESMMKEFTGLIRNAFIMLTDSIHFLYLPEFNSIAAEERPITDTLSVVPIALEMPRLPQAEMEGMHLLNLSAHDILRFWQRNRILEEEMPEMYNSDREDQVGAMQKLFQCWRGSEDRWMILMDGEGKIMTESGRKIVLSCRGSMEDEVKGLIQLLIKGSKEQRKEALLELEQLPHV